MRRSSRHCIRSIGSAQLRDWPVPPGPAQVLVDVNVAGVGWIRDDKLTVRIGRTYTLEAAAQAQDDLEQRRTTGKLLLDVRD